jgi:hypothetical protein
MKFKNAWNYDSAARQVDTGDFDFILDEGTDVGKAFRDVVLAAVTAGMVDYIEIFQQENNLLTVAEADTLYELIGTLATHLGELDPHDQYVLATALAETLADYVTESALSSELEDYVTATALSTELSDYSTTAAADLLYEPIGLVGGHEGAEDPHSQYTTDDEVTFIIASALEDYTPTFTRATTTITTDPLADAAVESGAITLAAGYRLLGFSADFACRVRLYISSDQRAADAGRAIGTDVDIATDHGLILEYVCDAAVDVSLLPTVDGFCPSGSTVYYSVQNLSGSTEEIEVAFDWIRTE